jgi:8-oxo-dGTP diphosphatase
MMRRFGDPVIRDQRYQLRHGAYAVLLSGDRVLVTHQQEPQPEFQLPGGGIDPGESPLRALHREVAEETGWIIARPRRLGAFRRFTFMPEYNKWAEKVCAVYVARPVRPHGPPIEKGHSAVWMSVETAARNLGNPGDRHFLNVAAGLQMSRDLGP